MMEGVLGRHREGLNRLGVVCKKGGSGTFFLREGIKWVYVRSHHLHQGFFGNTLHCKLWILLVLRLFFDVLAALRDLAWLRPPISLMVLLRGWFLSRRLLLLLLLLMAFRHLLVHFFIHFPQVFLGKTACFNLRSQSAVLDFFYWRLRLCYLLID